MQVAYNKKNYDTIYNRLYFAGITEILEENGVIKIYVTELAQAEKIKSELMQSCKASPKSIIINQFDNKNWNKEWEKTIEPVQINNKIIIYPSWKKHSLKNTKGKILIEIDPKMSFGTGHNETTQLILELMCDYITTNDKTMLDYGCGTGILAIAGIKLGLNKAIAIDIDSDGIENAEENIKNNNCENSIVLYQKEISEIKGSNFDIICANLTSQIIIQNLKNISKKLKPNGKLFITGILKDEKKSIINELKKCRFEIKEIRDKAEWTGLYGQKV